MLLGTQLNVDIESMLHEQIDSILIILLNLINQEILIPPLLQMLTLFGLQNDCFANFTLG